MHGAGRLICVISEAKFGDDPYYISVPCTLITTSHVALFPALSVAVYVNLFWPAFKTAGGWRFGDTVTTTASPVLSRTDGTSQ